MSQTQLTAEQKTEQTLRHYADIRSRIRINEFGLMQWG